MRVALSPRKRMARSIVRVNEKARGRYYLVQLFFRDSHAGQQDSHSKVFSYAKHGGSRIALAKAIRWRDKMNAYWR